jgi:uncharacterized FAD-dependent dehydrogenase
MQKLITLKLLPSEAVDNSLVRNYAAASCAVAGSSISGFLPIKSSIDARGKQTWIHLTINVFIDEPFIERSAQSLNLQDVSKASTTVIIVGTGPAGLFAALKLIENGIKPVLVERGKDIRARRRDLALLNKEGIINPESNYCFGEGGAGTYSDGKLYTRSSKRGSIDRILNILVEFGAEDKILYESHPHIGTNKLPYIITAMREKILACGGSIFFGEKVNDLVIENNTIKGVKTVDGLMLKANAVILATGHSARDIFEMLHHKKILIEFKPFALGIRIEHPQNLIDSIQYHCAPAIGNKQVRSPYLPPASYNLVEQVHERGAFSFCMCPGGIIAPAATNNGELVVNGWSPSKRNNPFANSGIVVAVEPKDISSLMTKNKELGGMLFQQSVEKKAFEFGGGKFVAPAQRMVDFTQKKLSQSLPPCSYLPGINSSPLNEVLPGFVYTSLQQAFIAFDKKMKGYFTNEAIVVATESRTSSPVRIPRHPVTLEHPQIKGLYPCGEGAGYAGGIVSAAMDGEKVAEELIKKLQ